VGIQHNSAIQTLSEVLQSSTGIEPAEFAERRLFAPIGMNRTRMTTDGAGNTNTFFGLQTTCRDLARFGLLFLNNGTWAGNQVVPAGYVEAATGAPSTELAASYGYLWWLNRDGRQVDPASLWTLDRTDVRVGQMVPGAPDDMFWALGLNDQVVQVDPGTSTVVVRLGALPPDGVDAFNLADTARVVTDAIKEP
jgi:CubicO group peptidase (beta-lactamase class C family)